MPARQAVFTITRGVPFLPTLAEALLSGRLVGPVADDPLALAAVTLYLPTRRAARALAAILADCLGRDAPGQATLLPRMIPLGEADEAELDLAAEPLLEENADPLSVPMPPLERRLILARLVQAWARTVDRTLLPLDAEVPFLVPSSPADAVGLAGDLERLMDALTVEGLPWSEIGAAVEAEYSRYFGLTLDFVKIAAENWPKLLVERGLADPVARARGLVLAEERRLSRGATQDPVVVAGSLGSVPATARLIAAVAKLPRGAVVLPGLDLDLDVTGWDGIDTGEGFSRVIAHGHPQAVLHRLLGPENLNIARAEVVPLGAPDPGQTARAALLSQALRPADTTDAWAALDPDARDATARHGLDGLALAEAADEREEALVAAVALREALQTTGATAALITPDRGLAGRVAVELLRWGIVAEDSAGLALAGSAAGRLARLAAELAADLARNAADAIPARLIALLSHPMVYLGLPRADVVRGAAALEIGLLRGPVPAPGFDGLRKALAAERAGPPEHRPRAKRRLKDIDWELAADLLDRLDLVFRDFPGPDGAGDCDLVSTATRHREACDRLVAGPDEAREDAREEGTDGSLSCLDALFDDLEMAEPGLMPGRFDDYATFFTSLARERTVACTGAAPHPRLRILGLLEARLLSVDRVVLGGLDEGVWPVRTLTDAFLNRPMRERVGLNPPERRIGQMAHDFVQALGCRDAVITRALKREGAPTVPSRLIQRLRALSGDARWDVVLEAGRRFSDLAARLDAVPPEPRLKRPAPKPDPALFPRSLSVTEIETLVRDPYSIFARHVLGLDPLDPLAAAPGVATRGSLVHEVFADFARRHPQALPHDATVRLLNLAVNAFADIEAEYPNLYAEWWPRFERMAAAYLDWEAQRRPGLTRVFPEVSGRWAIPMGRETFTLRARADRIELRPDGSACIVDYKTGAPPSAKMIFSGFSPQLTLEAAMLMHGAFADLPAVKTTPDLLYIHASGGRKPFVALPVKPPRGEERGVEAIVADHAERLRGLIARFLTGEAAYTARPYPQYASRYGAYDHLARVLEWSLTGEEGGE
ncbi:ATP-dependent helicase/nuclease subunit B [Methylobacterium phyllostachyos]|uniref:ATP-dependent helicase/nuclease subunit B n=1 Tax=Methylobacterium phyllostachyos TaxID=582672 RepID=A0A1G9X6Y5_9HYPH|nr:double-strand break repair protein AddB [Methylobacterium phyllostachyos]SDM92266.1 ATP-dependent helicase/nuclease subunit B [Methylobacterium phyllostachyos]